MSVRRFAVLAASAAVLSLGAVPAQAAGLSPAAAAGLNAMRELNLITLGDFNAAHDVEGKTWVGGNLNGGFSAGNGSQANPTQGAATSDYSTITVVGKMSGGDVNLNDGANGTHGTAGTGHYGVTVGGDTGKINFNAGNAIVKVGGSMNGDINFGSGADVSVHGSVNSVVTGGNSHVRTGGSVGGLTLGGNSTAAIGGNVSGNFNLNNGNNQVSIGGTFSGNVNSLSNGDTVAVNAARQGTTSGWTFSAGLSLTAPPAIDLSSDKTLMINNLQALSTALNAQPQTAITDINSALSFTGNYGVFSLTGAQFNAFTGDFKSLFANMTKSQTIIINVVGTNIVESGNNNIASSLTQNIIWNFVNATSVSLKGWNGSVLATNATVSNSSAINGSLVAKVFNQGGEVHLGTFDGAIPTGNVPEPASWMTMILGFGVTGSIIRRQRRKERLAAA